MEAVEEVQKKKTIDEFAADIKKRYPKYVNIDNTKLATDFVAKFPLYSKYVDLGTKAQPAQSIQAADSVSQPAVINPVADTTAPPVQTSVPITPQVQPVAPAPVVPDQPAQVQPVPQQPILPAVEKGNIFEGLGTGFQAEFGKQQKFIGQAAVDISGKEAINKTAKKIRTGEIDTDMTFSQGKEFTEWQLKELAKNSKGLVDEYQKIVNSHFSTDARGTDKATREVLREANIQRDLEKWGKMPEFNRYQKYLKRWTEQRESFELLGKEQREKVITPGGSMLPIPGVPIKEKTVEETLKSVVDQGEQKSWGEQIIDKGVENMVEAAASSAGHDGIGFKIGEYSASMIPLVAAMAARAIPVVGQPLSLALSTATMGGFVASGGGGMEYAYEENQKKLGKEIDPIDRALYGVAGGLAMAIPMMIGFKNLVPKELMTKTISETLLKGGFENGGRKVLVEFVQKNPELAKRLASSVGESAITGGSMMASTTELNIAIQNTFLEGEDKVGLLKAMEEGAKSFGMGTLMGLFFGPGKVMVENSLISQLRAKRGVVTLGTTKNSPEVYEFTGQDKDGNYIGFSRAGDKVVVAPEVMETIIDVPLDLFKATEKNVKKDVGLAKEQELYFYKGRIDKNLDELMRGITNSKGVVTKGKIRGGVIDRLGNKVGGDEVRPFEFIDVTITRGELGKDEMFEVRDDKGRKYTVTENDFTNIQEIPAVEHAAKLRQEQYQKIGLIEYADEQARQAAYTEAQDKTESFAQLIASHDDPGYANRVTSTEMVENPDGTSTPKVWYIRASKVNSDGKPMYLLVDSDGNTKVTNGEDLSEAEKLSLDDIKKQTLTGLNAEIDLALQPPKTDVLGFEVGMDVVADGIPGRIVNTRQITEYIEILTKDPDGDEHVITVPAEKYGTILPAQPVTAGQPTTDQPQMPGTIASGQPAPGPSVPAQPVPAQPAPGQSPAPGQPPAAPVQTPAKPTTLTIGKKVFPVEHNEDGSWYIPFNEGVDETKAITKYYNPAEVTLTPNPVTIVPSPGANPVTFNVGMKVEFKKQKNETPETPLQAGEQKTTEKVKPEAPKTTPAPLVEPVGEFHMGTRDKFDENTKSGPGVGKVHVIDKDGNVGLVSSEGGPDAVFVLRGKDNAVWNITNPEMEYKATGVRVNKLAKVDKGGNIIEKGTVEFTNSGIVEYGPPTPPVPKKESPPVAPVVEAPPVVPVDENKPTENAVPIKYGGKKYLVEGSKYWSVDKQGNTTPFTEKDPDKARKMRDLARDVKDAEEDDISFNPEELEIPEAPRGDDPGYHKWVSEYSTDPNEIASAHTKELMNRETEGLAPWQEAFLGTKISQDSWNRFGDPNHKASGLAKAWFIKKEDQVGNQGGIDGEAQALSDDFGVTVTPEMIVNFILQYPDNKVRKTTDNQVALAKRYNKVTKTKRYNEVTGKVNKGQEYPITPEEEWQVAVTLNDDLLEFIENNDIESVETLKKFEDEYFSTDSFPWGPEEGDRIRKYITQKTNPKADGRLPENKGPGEPGEGVGQNPAEEDISFNPSEFAGDQLQPKPETPPGTPIKPIEENFAGHVVKKGQGTPDEHGYIVAKTYTGPKEDLRGKDFDSFPIDKKIPDHVNKVYSFDVNGGISAAKYSWDIKLSDGKVTRVYWQPLWSGEVGAKYQTDHLEFRGPGASTTGYMSHFIQHTLVDDSFESINKDITNIAEELNTQTIKDLAKKAKTDKKNAKPATSEPATAGDIKPKQAGTMFDRMVKDLGAEGLDNILDNWMTGARLNEDGDIVIEGQFRRSAEKGVGPKSKGKKTDFVNWLMSEEDHPFNPDTFGKDIKEDKDWVDSIDKARNSAQVEAVEVVNKPADIKPAETPPESPVEKLMFSREVTSKMEINVPYPYDPSIMIDKRTIEYTGKAGIKYEKVFMLNRGETPNYPFNATEDEINKLKDQVKIGPSQTPAPAPKGQIIVGRLPKIDFVTPPEKPAPAPEHPAAPPAKRSFKPKSGSSKFQNLKDVFGPDDILSEPENPYVKTRDIKIEKVLQFGIPAAIELHDIIVEATGEFSFDDYAQSMVDEIGPQIRPYLKAIYNSLVDMPELENTKFSEYSYIKSFDVSKLQQDTQPNDEEMRSNINEVKNDQNAGSKSGDITGNRQDTGNKIPVDQANIQGQSGTGGQLRGETDSGTGQAVGANPENSEFAGGFLLPNVDSPAPASGKRGDKPVRPGQKEPGITGRPAGDINAGGGNQGSLFGPPDRTTGVEGDVEDDTDYAEDVTKGIDIVGKKAKQVSVENVPAIYGDINNIAETLPALFPQQHDDVLKAEKRFFSGAGPQNEMGKGMLFTNSTGTGKTFSGMGIVKRALKNGAKHVLIVTPSQPINNNWMKVADILNLKDIEILPDTFGIGTNKVIVTTYSNFRQNQSLKNVDFDLILYDESQTIMSSKKGKQVNSTLLHYQMSNRDVASATERLKSVHPLWMEYERLVPEWRDLEQVANHSVFGSERYKNTILAIAKIEKRFEELKAEQDKVIFELTERAKQAVDKTKVVFLSATPFNQHFSLQYANKYLFDWGGNDANRSQRGPSAEQKFFIENFGYGYRQGNITKPADESLLSELEMNFAERLRENGSLSGRALESDMDYSRDFPIVVGVDADRYNAAISDLLSYGPEFKHVRQYAHKVFFGPDGYEYSTQLFEAMKATLTLDRIQQHLDLGRKVIIYHRRHKSEVLPPFQTISKALEKAGEPTEGVRVDISEALFEWENFKQKYPDLIKYDNELVVDSVIKKLVERFGDQVVQLNGQVTPKKKQKNIDLFNDPNSGKNIFAVQEQSGKEGINLHDTFGNKPRVLINMALPQSPITALQIEGRPYRIGTMSNVVFEYPILNLDLELYLFGQNFNKLLGTTENLAMGRQSRDLISSFRDGVVFGKNTDVPSLTQGTGGKALDARPKTEPSKYDLARATYLTNLKRTSKTKSQEGTDYYPTPEPIGLAMVDWLYLTPGEEMMEPSAGNGAVAMWTPKGVKATFIEPSYELFTKLEVRAGGTGHNLKNQDFESYNTISKFHGIAMNPPYGVGGKTAMEHLSKALKHLKNGGRVVAIIPNGPAMDKRLDKFFDPNEDNYEAGDYHIIAEIILPSVTFERAGTSVNTKILVIDKIIPQKPKSLEKFKEEVRAEDASGLLRERGRTIRTREEIATEATRRYQIALAQSNAMIPPTRRIDFSLNTNINDLFESIMNVPIPDRVRFELTEEEKRLAQEEKDNTIVGVKHKISTDTGYNNELLHVIKLVDYLGGTQFSDAKAKAVEIEKTAYYQPAGSRFHKAGFVFKTKEGVDAFSKYLKELSWVKEQEVEYKVGETFKNTLENADEITLSEVNRAYGSKRKAISAVEKTIADAMQLRLDFSVRGGNTLSDQGIHKSAVIQGFQESGYVDFVGRKITGAADIVDLWSIHRSPYIEKSHVIYLKNNEIIGSLAVTANSMGHSIMPSYNIVSEMFDALGADGYYMLHNHPAGTPEPSKEDLRATKLLSSQLLLSHPKTKFKGHIILDHTKWTLIKEDAVSYSFHDFKNPVPNLYKPRVNAKDKESIGVIMQDRMGEIGRSVLSAEGYHAAIMYIAADMSLNGYEPLPVGTTTREVGDFIKDRFKGKKGLGVRAVIVHNGSFESELIYGKQSDRHFLPGGILDVINAKTGEQFDSVDHYFAELRRSKEIHDTSNREVLWAQEPLKRYEGLSPQNIKSIEQKSAEFDIKINGIKKDLGRVKREIETKKGTLSGIQTTQGDLFAGNLFGAPPAPVAPKRGDFAGSLFDVAPDASDANVERMIAPLRAQLDRLTNDLLFAMKTKDNWIDEYVKSIKGQGKLFEPEEVYSPNVNYQVADEYSRLTGMPIKDAVTELMREYGSNREDISKAVGGITVRKKNTEVPARNFVIYRDIRSGKTIEQIAYERNSSYEEIDRALNETRDYIKAHPESRPMYKATEITSSGLNAESYESSLFELQTMSNIVDQLHAIEEELSQLGIRAKPAMGKKPGTIEYTKKTNKEPYTAYENSLLVKYSELDWMAQRDKRVMDGDYYERPILLEPKGEIRMAGNRLVNEQIIDMLLNVNKGVINGPYIEIFERMVDLPADVQPDNPDTALDGVFFGNTAYFVLENIANAEAAIKTYIHEVGVHYGLHNVIPRALFDSLMRKIVEDIGIPTIKETMSDSGWLDVVGDEPAMGEEYLAYLSGKINSNEDLNPKELSIWRKFINKVLDILRKIFKLKGKITEKECEDIVHAAIQSTRQPKVNVGYANEKFFATDTKQNIFVESKLGTTGTIQFQNRRLEFNTLGNYYTEGLQKLAHDVKDGDTVAIKKAAEKLLSIIPQNAIVVPIPSRTGNATTTLLLAKEISKLRNDVSINDILKGKERQSLYEAKKSGMPLGISDMEISLSSEPPVGRPVIMLDNVVATGTTAMAANIVLPNATLVAIASSNTPFSKVRPKGVDIETKLNDTPEFKKWFDGSKVVDKSGNPMVVYHRSDKPGIRTLKPRFADGWGTGIYFSDNTNLTNYGAESYPVYLSMKNPMTMAKYNKLSEKDIENTVAYENALKNTRNKYEDPEPFLDAMEEMKESPAFRNEVIRELGYDGIISDLLDGEKGTEFVVFDSKQVRSVENNTYGVDIAEPNVRYKSVSKAVIQAQHQGSWNGAIDVTDLDAKDRLRVKLQDKELPILRFQEKIKQVGGVFTKDMDVWDLLPKNRSMNRTHIEDFETEQARPMLESLAEIVIRGDGHRKYDYEEVTDYLYAKEALNRNERLSNKKGKTTIENQSGMTQFEAQTIVDTFEGAIDPNLVDKMNEMVRQATDFTLRTWRDAGFMSPEEYNEYRSRDNHYVPLRGWEDLQADDIYEFMNADMDHAFNPALLEAKGRKSKADDPIPYIISMAHTAVVAGNKNLAKQRLLRLAEENYKQFPRLINFKKVYEVKAADGSWAETIDRPPQILFDNNEARTKTFKKHGERATKRQKEQFEVEVWRNGEKYVVITDPQIVNALNNNESSLGGLMGKFSTATRLWSALTTSKNPMFVLPNILRDGQFGAVSINIQFGTMPVYSQSLGKKAYPGDMFRKHYKDADYTITRWQHGQYDPNNPADVLFKRWRDLGGPTGFVYMQGIDKIKKKAYKDIRELTSLGKKKKPQAYIAKGFEIIGTLTTNLAEYSELLARYSAFLTAMDFGSSETDAVTLSKNITTNFDRSGKWTKNANALWSFFNARVQGATRFFELYGIDKKSMVAYCAAMFAMGELLSTLLDWFYGDDKDEDGVKKFDKFSKYLRRGYLMIPIPGTDKTVSIPNMHGFGAFYTLGAILHEVHTGRTSPGTAALTAIDSFQNSFLPVDLGSIVNPDGGLTLGPLLPTLLVPIYSIGANRNYANQIIYKEPFVANQDIASSQLYLKNVNPIIKKVTNAMYIGGGGDLKTKHLYYDGKNGEDKKVPWLLDWNPSKVEYILEYYSSGAGQFYNKMFKSIFGPLLEASARAEEEETSKNTAILRNYRDLFKEHPGDIPVINRFLRHASGDPIREEYFDQRLKFERYMHHFNETINIGTDTAKINRMMNQRMFPNDTADLETKYSKATRFLQEKTVIDDWYSTMNTPGLSKSTADSIKRMIKEKQKEMINFKER